MFVFLKPQTRPLHLVARFKNRSDASLLAASSLRQGIREDEAEEEMRRGEVRELEQRQGGGERRGRRTESFEERRVEQRQEASSH